MKRLFIILLAAFFSVSAYSNDLATAKKALEAEQFGKAKGILENLVKANPNNGEMHFFLGKFYLTSGEYAKAAEIFNKGVNLPEKGYLNNIGLGQIALNEGRASDAAAYFDKAAAAMKRKDIEEQVLIAEAYIYSSNPDYAKAAGWARKTIEEDDKLASAHLVLGDALRHMANPDSYASYRTAFELDNNLVLARLRMAVMEKQARSFDQAIKGFNDIIAANPNYGPAFRELAEAHFLRSLSDKANSEQHLVAAAENYKKYMELSDYSLDARMRYADFLILSKRYTELEAEAKEIQKIDNVNPRIFRYLGYAAFANSNYAEAIEALNKFIASVEAKRVIELDYMYLAKAEAQLAIAGDSVADGQRFNAMIDNLKNALAKAEERKAEDPSYGNFSFDEEFSQMGANLYKAKQYEYAVKLFGVLLQAPESSLVDNLYFANSVLYFVASKSEEERANFQDLLLKADATYDLVISKSPTTQDPYFNRARLNRYITNDMAANNVANYYQGYIDAVIAKGEAELSKDIVKSKMGEAYTAIGAFYSDIDKQKAIENFEKALQYDPGNQHAINSLEFLKEEQ